MRGTQQSASVLPLGLPPTTSRYRPIVKLGEGGTAEVFLASMHGGAGLNKLVVLKVLKAALSEDAEFVEMFLDEARLAARLSHPNVVQTYDVEMIDGRPALIMEYLDGAPLSAIRKASEKNPLLTLPIQLEIIRQALHGLHSAHELKDYDRAPLGVVHRDFTPANLFVSFEGAVKVLDFGIAKAANRTGNTQTGTMKGTIRYISPEVVLGEPVDRRSDIYSAGVVLWETLTGRSMWDAVDDFAVLQRVAEGAIPPIAGVATDIDPRLAMVCERAMAPAADDRYATALEMADAIEECIGTLDKQPTTEQTADVVARLFARERESRRALLESRLGKNGEVAGAEASRPKPDHATDSGAHDWVTNTTSTSTRAGTLPAKAKPSSRVRRGAVLIGAFAVAVLGWTYRSAEEELRLTDTAPLAIPTATMSPAQPVPPTAVPPTAVPPVPPSPPDAVSLDIRAMPSHAEIVVDGERTNTNPAQLDLKVGTGDRKVTVSAPGFVTERRVVRADSSIELDILLRPLPPRNPTPASASTPNGLKIDTTSPWKKQ